MIWHTSTATKDSLAEVIADIRHQGGTIASCLHFTSGIGVTWFTL